MWLLFVWGGYFLDRWLFFVYRWLFFGQVVIFLVQVVIFWTGGYFSSTGGYFFAQRGYVFIMLTVILDILPKGSIIKDLGCLTLQQFQLSC